MDQAPNQRLVFLPAAPLPSRVFFYSSGSLHFRLSGRVFFYRGSLHPVSLFLPTAEKAEIRLLAGLEPQTFFVRFIKDKPLSYSVSRLLIGRGTIYTW